MSTTARSTLIEPEIPYELANTRAYGMPLAILPEIVQFPYRLCHQHE
jgi:hypothetical protein